MKQISKLFVVLLFVVANMTFPRYAQYAVTTVFTQDGIDMEKKCHRVTVGFSYIGGCEELERACANFFFGDSASVTLDEALGKHLSQYKKLKKARKEVDVEHVYSIKASGGISGKHINYMLERIVVTNEKNTEKKRHATWNVVWDTEAYRLKKGELSDNLPL